MLVCKEAKAEAARRVGGERCWGLPLWLRPAGSQQCGEMCLDSGCILRVEPAGFAGELNVRSKRKRLEDLGTEQLELQRLAEVGGNGGRGGKAQKAALGTQKSKP